jgi:cytochrome b6-f complex iron-sulfur subunit
MKNISRRDFLKLTTNSLLAFTGILGVGGLIRFLSYKADPTPQTEFDIGPAMNYPPKSRTILANIPAVVVHDGDGIHAVSLTCTHLGCTVEERNFGFECPCHSSRYDPAGNVLKGPAAANLKKLRITEAEDGNLHVFTV